MFTDSAAPFVLKVFGKIVDSSGMIVDEDTGLPVTDRHGDKIMLSEFGGIGEDKCGQPEFFKNDLLAIMNIVEK